MAARRAADAVFPSESASGVGSWTAIPEAAQQAPVEWSAQPQATAQAAQTAQEGKQDQNAWDADSDDDAPPQDFNFFAEAPQASASVPAQQ